MFQVMNLCWEHGLYDGIIHVYNQGMKDYVSPFEELVAALRLKQNDPKDDKTVLLGNKILVYLSCCLSGRGFLSEDFEKEVGNKIRTEVTRINLDSKN